MQSRPFLTILLLLIPAEAAFAGDVSISTGANHSSGRYGSASATRVTSASVGANATARGWDLSATLPYLDIEPGGSEVTVGGLVIQPDRNERIRGFGDMFVTAGRALPIGDEFPVELTAQAQIKVPTGSSSLSTGKVDAGLDLEMSRTFGSLTPSLSLGYRWYGDSPDLELANGWTASAGASFSYRGLVLIGSYDWSDSPLGLQSLKELFGVASASLAPGWNWSIYGSKGLNEGAADFMMGFGISRTLGNSVSRPRRTR